MLNRLYTWYGKKTVLTVLVVLIVLILAVIFISGGEDSASQASEPQLRTVEVTSVASLSSESTIAVVGTVEAVNESTIESEASGRIVSVPVELGATVGAGQIIAQIENAAERAAVLQAEGAYEAALAAAAQSDVGVEDAETSLASAKTAGVNTYRSAFITADDVIKSLVDELFLNPSSNRPALRIDGQGDSVAINSQRIAMGQLLDAWAASVTVVSEESVTNDLAQAEADTLTIIAFVELFSNLVDAELEENDGANFTLTELNTYQSRFLTARTSLNSTLVSIESARAAVENAEEALETAELAGTNTELSAANASVKQALGSLRSAQATLSKTIIRTPISGTVNTLDVKAGDFIGIQSPIAIVANNNALEITTFIGERDRERITEGDTVTIEDEHTGTITNIAPAINPDTRKVEIKIQTETSELSNGDTVSVTLNSNDTQSEIDEAIFVPLTAVKFTATDGSVFKIENGAVTPIPVTLGDVRGSSVEILSGLAVTDEIIVDARGVNVGQQVEVMN